MVAEFTQATRIPRHRPDRRDRGDGQGRPRRRNDPLDGCGYRARDVSHRHGIEPLAEQLDIVDKFESAIWNGFRYRGKIWSLPNDANTLLLWSNQRLFENAGMLDLYPPTNWEQMIQICEADAKQAPAPQDCAKVTM